MEQATSARVMRFIVTQTLGPQPKPKPRRRAPIPGIKRRRREMKISMDELTRLYQSGMTWSQIEKVAGLPHSLLRYRLTESGVALTRPSRHTRTT